jgi:SAM-dependent methyltransferase
VNMLRAPMGVGDLPPLTASAWLRFDAIKRAIAIARPRRILEVGVGEGALASWLARRGEFVGVETDDAARAIAVNRLAGGPGRVVAEVSSLRGRTFDLLCAFEVLEHIDDDVAALREWSELLAPGGWTLLSVPAHQARFGPQDRAVGHRRRYEAADLRDLFREVGFEPVMFESYGAGAGFVLEGVRNLIASRAPEPPPEVATAGSGRYLQPGSRRAALVRAALAAPARVLQHPLRHTDLGIGYVVLGCRR